MSPLQREHFKLKKHTRYLTIHRLAEQKSWHRLAYEYHLRKENRKIPKIVRKRFLLYHLEQHRSRMKLKRLQFENKDENLYVAKQWYYVLEKYPLKPRNEWSFQRVHKLNTRNEQIAKELEEILDCSERFALIQHFLDGFEKMTESDLKKLEKIEQFQSGIMRNRDFLMKSQSLAAMKTRLFFEQRKGLIFKTSALIDSENGQVSIKRLRELIVSKISTFHKEIEDHLLKNDLKSEKKKKLVMNSIMQETTNAAFNTIQDYLKTFKTRHSMIIVEGSIVDKKIHINCDQIRYFLKDPINQLCSMDNVRIPVEDSENWQEEVASVVDVLSHEFIIAHPLIKPYAFLVEDYKVASKYGEEELIKMYDDSTILQIRLSKVANEISIRCFIIRIEKVWKEMERRIRSFRNALKMAIRRKFTSTLNKLLQDFRKYDRALQYRSIDPSLMLNNKAQVDLMLQNEIWPSVNNFVQAYEKIFEITQHVSLDTSQLDTLLNIASLRLSLPQSINDHAHFFNKRISTFLHFVNKKQTRVMANVQKAMEKLKVLQTMGNPQEVDNYVEQMNKLKPMLDVLIKEIEDLNKFEKAVDVPVSDVTKMRQFVSEVESMENLFLATSGYYKHVNAFFESRRALVNIEATRAFIEQFTVQLSIFESSLSSHRAAKHFIAYARNEVDNFKKNFAVAEVMSCRRLLDAHWIRMSEIVGFDLTPYANSSIAQICELGLETHLQKLKPIAFSAEREATSADQLHEIVTFWSHEPLEMTCYSQWKLSLASHLPTLVEKIQNDNYILRHMTNVEKITDDSLPHWIEWSQRAEKILKDWNETQDEWKRVANIFVTCRQTLQSEFELLRVCAQYWMKIEKGVAKDPAIYRLIHLPHLPCWIFKIRSNVSIIIKGVRNFLEKIRISSARLCLSSELHLLQLFSATSVEIRLKLLMRDCFPSLKRICFNRRNQLEMVDSYAEKITLELTKSEIENLDPVELIKAIENAFAAKLTEIITYERLDRSKSVSRIGLNVAEVMETRGSIDPLFLSRVDKSYFVQHKSIQKQSQLTVDFVYSTEVARFVPKSLADAWSNNKIIVLVGEVCATRLFVLKLANSLCSNVRIVNSHDQLHEMVLERILKVNSMSSWFVLLENIDLLTSQLWFKLFKILSKEATPFSRVFLSTTEEINSSLPSNVSVEPLKSIHLAVSDSQHLHDEKSSSSFVFEMNTGTPMSSVRSMSLSSNRQVTNAPPSSPHAILLDKISSQIRNHEISGCTGSMAKYTLKEVLGQFAEKVIWIYVDVFTRTQLIASHDEFAASPSGIIFDVLYPDAVSAGGDSERSYHSSVSTSSISIQTIVVFYGYSQFWSIFPFLSPLFNKKDRNLPDKPFLTLDDGSTFWPQENFQFLMCIPDEEGYHLSTVTKHDIPCSTIVSSTKQEVARCYKKEWQKKFAELFNKISLSETMDEMVDQVVVPAVKIAAAEFFWPSMLFQVIYQDLTEILPQCRTSSMNDAVRICVIFATSNFLAIFVSDRYQLQQQIVKSLAKIKTKLSIQIPDDVCNFKISLQDITKLNSWEDEPFCQSSIDKESSIGNIMIVTPLIDRLLFYAFRLLQSNQNMIVHGPSYSRKTTFVKMIEKCFPNRDDVEFVWIDGKSRVGSEVAQKKFVELIETCEKRLASQQLFVVFDRFSFTEPLLPIIEFFVDHQTFWKDGTLCKSNCQMRMIIITDDADYTWLHKTNALSSTFVGISMPETSFRDQKTLVQSLIAANFSAKSFSSEYHHILENLSECIVEIKNLSSMALSTRLAKAFFFAFPDNCPDPDALIRLFIHETTRVVGDSIDPNNREEFAKEFEEIVNAQFSTTTVQTLLKSIICVGEDDTEIEEMQQNLDIYDLAYSEIDAHDVVDGLSYEPVVDRVQFQRSIENFLFEHHRNHPNDRIRLYIDWEAGCWVQRVMRVIRQASEHMVLAAKPGSGRSQIVKAACVVSNSTMMHIQIDASSYETFIQRWEYTFSRAINIIANTNQHVVVLCHFDFCYEKIEPRWMELIKLWIESPNTQHLVSDEQLHLIGEQLIECEKNLATQMQTVGLRLPGQRMCKYLPVETLKDPVILRKVLEARILDALHIVFLVDPQFKYDFSWCTIFHLPMIERSRMVEKVRKITADCKIEAAEIIVSTFFIVKKYLTSGSHFMVGTTFSQLFEVADNFQMIYTQQKK
ncbi:unnamed protein product [Caenorhabditis bovis]|uniref:Dynein heavy chain linker domain-containing protein n=1 Tax=Caenorhabditis bovis TaxID=2654633 RepID=A0A8S1ES92_9PELO|nr:unnamed protein product [Caenorhabditis bovis]